MCEPKVKSRSWGHHKAVIERVMEEWSCPECFWEVDPQWKFCPQCGFHAEIED